MLRPAALAPGARVALIAPAGPVGEEKIEAALARCAAFGLEPVLGESARARRGYLAGPDEARLADLARAIADPAIDAIWALRGGYGTMRLLRSLDLAPLARRPRPFIGFSDNTALHLALGRAGVVSFHGPHAAGEFPPMTEACFRSVLFDAAPAELPRASDGGPSPLIGGRAQGRLAGGNLSLLAASCGTPFALDARGAILFLEEVGEPAYRVDRAITQLRLSGCLDGIAGLVIGRFTETPGDADADVAAVLAETAESLGAPAVSGAPIGHVAENWTLPLGVRAVLDADAGTLNLLEPAVARRTT